MRYTERMLENWQPGELRNAHADAMALTFIAAKVPSTPGGTTLPRSASFPRSWRSRSLRRPFAIDAIPIPGNIRYVRACGSTTGDKIIRERRERAIRATSPCDTGP